MLPPIITSAAAVAAVSLKLMVKVLLEFGVDAAFSVLFVSLKFFGESPPYWWRVRWMQGKNAKPGSEWNASSKRMFFRCLWNNFWLLCKTNCVRDERRFLVVLVSCFIVCVCVYLNVGGRYLVVVVVCYWSIVVVFRCDYSHANKQIHIQASRLVVVVVRWWWWCLNTAASGKAQLSWLCGQLQNALVVLSCAMRWLLR